jgi:hypothetical protein
MDNEDFVAFVGKGSDLASQGAHRGFVFEQSTSELDYGFH